MKFFHVYFAFILLEIFGHVFGDANKKLKYYEVIDSSDIKHQIHKRSLHDDRKEITLPLLGRTFELSLFPKPELFSQSFQAVTVDENGTETEFFVNKNDFYYGFVKGEEEDSSVTMEIDEDMVTAAIETKNDTYHLEPSSGLIDGDTKNKMIVYRDSDVIWNVTFAGNHTKQERYCGMADAGKRSETNHTSGRERRSTRTRRALKTKRECGLVLVADFRYYENIGQKSRKKTTYAMVGVINRVDEIFKNTDWSDDPADSYRGFGFVIKKIHIHEQPSNGDYNTVYEPAWRIKDLLEEFSRKKWEQEFCLAHLFTYQDFANGVIGLAYVAHPDESSRGGICSQEDRGMWHNTGLSSSINWGNQLLTTEADIVTAHELGHNFGSEHDVQDNPVCSPDSGGKYIMYPASVSGQESNNNKFSSCSRKQVKAVLASKSSLCFSEPDTEKFCGNFRVEKDEKCDPGDNSDDKCCTSDCKFKGIAVCSDTNFQCCSGCQIASNKTQCAQAQPLLCRKAVFCNGISDRCPDPEYADEGTECIERGRCNSKGECVPFCKSTVGVHYEPCLCTNEADACYVCCKNTRVNGTCEVYHNTTSGRIPMSDGRLCSAGVCRKQKCEKAAQDIITRLQDFFDTLGDPSKFGEFLKDNIVGTVIVFSLIAWIPLSIIVHRIDKRRDKQAEELARWQHMENQDLIRQRNRKRDNFDVVFKKDAVLIRDSRKAKGRGVSPRGHRGPTVQ